MTDKIIFCNCKGEVAQAYNLPAIEELLQKNNIPYTSIDDICGLAATAPNNLREIAGETGSKLVIACHQRTIERLWEFAGIDTSKSENNYINHRVEAIEDIEQKIKDFASKHSIVPTAEASAESNPEWPSWYPIIDYERCTNCGQCADFCLFGVYEKIDEKVKVSNPQACKNYCPACARICPHTAIIFPKFQEGGAISGSEQIDEATEKNRLEKDLQAITGGDIYKTLEMRKRKRQSIIKKEAMDKAMSERDHALKKLKGEEQQES